MTLPASMRGNKNRNANTWHYTVALHSGTTQGQRTINVCTEQKVKHEHDNSILFANIRFGYIKTEHFAVCLARSSVAFCFR